MGELTGWFAVTLEFDADGILRPTKVELLDTVESTGLRSSTQGDDGQSSASDLAWGSYDVPSPGDSEIQASNQGRFQRR